MYEKLKFRLLPKRIHFPAFILILYVLAVPVPIAAQSALLQTPKLRQDSIYELLDSFIRNKPGIFTQKERKINTLREAWKMSPSSFANNLLLFNEYKSYHYDSAYVYANRLLTVAQKEHDPTHVVEAKGAVLFCLLSAGLFKEASDIAQSMDLDGVDKEGRIAYYSLLARLHFDLSDYNHKEPFFSEYVRQGCQYSDSLLSLLPPGSKEALYAKAQRQMKLREYDAAIHSFEKYLKLSDDVHEQAIVLSCLGYIYYKVKGDSDRSLHYMIQAAINDIRGAITETTALCSLASQLYEEGDVLRANRYISLAMEDAVFYNARHRKIEVGSILPLIEETRYQQLEESRNTLRIYFFIIIGLLVLMCIAVVIICLQMKRGHTARRNTAERNKLLEEMNGKLEEANTKLEETCNIKDEFIGMSFYVNSECITRMENLYKTINRKIAARQTEDLKSMFKENELKQEREEMYRSFDHAFLRLFPSFIEEFEKMAPYPKNDERPKNGTPDSLTPEMRIFALIRLGITEVDRIAKFLNYSVHTINAYKTRVKNRSTISNDKFEARIMEIRSGH